MSAYRMTNHCAFALGFVVLAFVGCQDDDRPPPRQPTTASATSSSTSSGSTGTGGVGGGNGGSGGNIGGMGGNGAMPPEPFCGDAVINPGEECDDGNQDIGDGCRPDCTVESSEVEPNNTFSEANPYVANPFYLAKVAGGDVDFIAFPVSTANTSVVVKTYDVGDGACAKNELDSYVEILASDGMTVLASDDDAGEGYCSRAVVSSLPVGNYFVRVAAAPKAGNPSFIYQLKIDQIANVCGDGTVTPGEECDDGNNMSNDGCSSACKIEISETEANGTPATANTFVMPWNAVLDPAGDVDVVLVNLPMAAMTFTATTNDQGSGACAAKTLDTVVEILASNGSTVLASGDDIVGNCGSALVTNPAAGNYYVRIKGGSLATYPSAYGLTIIVQ